MFKGSGVALVTPFNENGVNFDALDRSPKENELTKNKINELRYSDTLEMMSPAGGWVDANLMPDMMVDNAINNEEYHLFRPMNV